MQASTTNYQWSLRHPEFSGLQTLSSLLTSSTTNYQLSSKLSQLIALNDLFKLLIFTN